MHRTSTVMLLTLICVIAILSSGCASLKPSTADGISEQIPSPPREFRAAWVATVANIDWPSEPGLSTSKQKAEIITILDKALKKSSNPRRFQGLSIFFLKGECSDGQSYQNRSDLHFSPYAPSCWIFHLLVRRR